MNDQTSSQADASGDDPARDLRLMEHIKTGDEEAFRTLVEIHQFRVISTCASLLGDEAKAEDLAQQVFGRVWKNAARWKRTAKFTTWLYTILRNLVFNECRRRKKDQRGFADET